jgi:hypothetical protein
MALQVLNEYIEKVKVSKTGILVACLRYGEYMYTKGDIFDFFGMYEDVKFTKTAQRPSGFLVIRKNEFAFNFIKEWNDIYCNHFELATDTPSIKPNFEGFIENRHDQSILSLLSKKYDVDTIPYNFDNNDNVPFQMKRDKNFSSKVG